MGLLNKGLKFAPQLPLFRSSLINLAADLDSALKNDTGRKQLAADTISRAFQRGVHRGTTSFQQIFRRIKTATTEADLVFCKADKDESRVKEAAARRTKDMSSAAAVASAEREARSVALETAYVHDVYEEISWRGGSGGGRATNNPGGGGDNQQQGQQGTRCCRAWPRVKQFLSDLEPGSLVCDVGCGNGKYLSINPDVFKIGADRCSRLTEMAREKEHELRPLEKEITVGRGIRQQ
ncbi:tRNA (carboxymethyluridine(34)-5-O)-methyltransferase-like [Ischnura elegans]|uniref:tRNA (carboxymethyluridine(34)-5-O)-methyltransferase-like n=1 Tax=Ischnura elegans TaxID=197161 RepID=UPI001ED8A855|nr:tRNA (carboxymethyluridine(34)-5-O)-methyltransferase-like [Ischnura elegans]